MGVAARRAVLLACIASATGACARDTTSPPVSPSDRQRAAFQAARDRCGVTVADTADVQRCMRAQGWTYRLPWQ